MVGDHTGILRAVVFSHRNVGLPEGLCGQKFCLMVEFLRVCVVLSFLVPDVKFLRVCVCS